LSSGGGVIRLQAQAEWQQAVQEKYAARLCEGAAALMGRPWRIEWVEVTAAEKTTEGEGRHAA
jgi:hypothetical protein